MHSDRQFADELKELSDAEEFERMLKRTYRRREPVPPEHWDLCEWNPRESSVRIAKRPVKKQPRIHELPKLVLLQPPNSPPPLHVEHRKRRSISNLVPDTKSPKQLPENPKKREPSATNIKASMSMQRHVKLHPILIKLSTDEETQQHRVPASNYRSINVSDPNQMLSRIKSKVQNLSKLKRLQEEYSDERIIAATPTNNDQSFINRLFRTKRARPDPSFGAQNASEEPSILFSYKSQQRYA